MNTIKNNFGTDFEIKVTELQDGMEFRVMGPNGEVGHLVANSTNDSKYLAISDAYIDMLERGKGLWKNLMYYARDAVKALGYKGLFSAGQFRRPASNRSWKGMTDKIEKMNAKTH